MKLLIAITLLMSTTTLADTKEQYWTSDGLKCAFSPIPRSDVENMKNLLGYEEFKPTGDPVYIKLDSKSRGKTLFLFKSSEDCWKFVKVFTEKRNKEESAKRSGGF